MVIVEVFKRDRGEARDLGRHKDMGTTEEAYRHLDVEEQRDRLDELLNKMEEQSGTPRLPLNEISKRRCGS